MKTFFELAIKDVLSQVSLEKTFFIIPNRRSKVFLKKEIIEIKKIINNSEILKKIIKKDKIQSLLKKNEIQHSESKFLFSLLNIAIIENLNK